MVPNPLDQEPPSDSVHVVRGTICAVQHLPRVRPTTARSVNALAEIGDFHGENGVPAGVPSVHQGVRRKLGNLVTDHADHAVHARVAVRRPEWLQPRDIIRYGEGVGAHAGTQLGGVAHPGVRERVPHDRREGEVVETTDVLAEILNVHVFRCEEEGLAVGVKPVVLLLPEPDRSRDVCAGLVRVELDRFPPAGNRRALGIDFGDGVDELPDDPLLVLLPSPVPNGVDGDVRRQNRAHVVLQMDELRRPFILFGATDVEIRGVGFLARPWAPPANRAHVVELRRPFILFGATEVEISGVDFLVRPWAQPDHHRWNE
ncbi:hypothetical protein U1Q18_002809 [Sarracenia purpurea var. burkii]